MSNVNKRCYRIYLGGILSFYATDALAEKATDFATKTLQKTEQWNGSQGIQLTAIGVQSSLGFQRYHRGVGVWRQTCNDVTPSEFVHPTTVHTCWQMGVRAGIRSDVLPSNNRTVNTALSTEILRGFTMGPETLQVNTSAGLGYDGLLGGMTSLQSSHRLSFVTEVGIYLPLSFKDPQETSQTLWLSGQQRYGLHRADSTFQLGWGQKW